MQRVTLSFFFRRIVRWHNYRYGITCTHEATHLLNTQRAAITKVCHTEYTHMHTHTHTMLGRGRIERRGRRRVSPPPRVVFFRFTLRLNRIKCLRHVNCITWHVADDIRDLRFESLERVGGRESFLAFRSRLINFKLFEYVFCRAFVCARYFRTKIFIFLFFKLPAILSFFQKQVGYEKYGLRIF